MPIYRKGEDQSALATAAATQKKERRAAGPEARAEAGRAPISNGMVRSDGTAYKYRYDKPVGADGKHPTEEITNQPVSGTVVAERAAKLKEKGELPAVPKQGNRRALPGGNGVIKGGYLQEKTAPVKKKAAGVKDVRAALKGGHITIDEAEGLNKKGLSSPIKKKKK